MRIKIGIFFLSEPNFDENALKFMLLSLNKTQDHFQFEFPEIDEKKYPIQSSGPSFLRTINPIYLKKDNLYDLFPKIKTKCNSENYYVGIMNVGIESNLFWDCRDNAAIITTDAWERLFAPPSVFEYLIHSIIAAIVQMASETEGSKLINSHRETKGCLLDYTYFKEDYKVKIPLGNICDECTKQIMDILGKDYLMSIQKMVSRDWIGEVETVGSIAYEMKKFFRVDLNKDTGFYKSTWSKVKESFSDFPKEILLVVTTVVITSVITYFLTR